MAAVQRTIDSEKSTVSFSIKKLLLLTIKGQFSSLSGTIVFDENHPENSSFDVRVGSATVNTQNEKRDEHLRTADFFDVQNHPTIAFRSSSVSQEGGGYLAQGQLQLLGQSQALSIPFTYQDGRFEGTFELRRSDYGLGRKFPTLVVGDAVRVNIHCTTLG